MSEGAILKNPKPFYHPLLVTHTTLVWVEWLIPMCLAIPAKVLEMEGSVAKVDFGDGTVREVNVSLVNAHVNEYVIVHAGFAIEVLDEDEAKRTLELWREILSQETAM